MIIIPPSKDKPFRYIINTINQKCPGWELKNFIDTNIAAKF